MKDKREECGCHKTCTVLPHECDKPCKWPSCLTSSESIELSREVAQDFGEVLYGPFLECEILTCNFVSWTAHPFERHELSPGVWRWICYGDVVGAGLDEGK